MVLIALSLSWCILWFWYLSIMLLHGIFSDGRQFLLVPLPSGFFILISGVNLTTGAARSAERSLLQSWKYSFVRFPVTTFLKKETPLISPTPPPPCLLSHCIALLNDWIHGTRFFIRTERPIKIEAFSQQFFRTISIKISECISHI